MNSGSLAKLILIALVFLLLSAAPVSAQPVTHNNIDTYAKLVAAIDTSLTNGFADTINITADITLEASLPQITSTVTINGGGNTINGDGKYRPFNNASGGVLTLNNLIIANAYVARASGTTPHGASIRSLGELTLNRVVVRNGKTDPDTSSGQHSVGAGGIYIGAGSSPTKIKDSAIYNNRSRGEGTGIRIAGSTVTIVNTSIFGNTSSHGRGGGIYMGGGTLHLYHSTITNNTPNSSGVSNFGNQVGGGIRVYGGTVSIVNSIIYGNASDDCAIRTDSSVTITQIAGNIIESGSTSNCTSGQTTDDPDLVGPSVHGLGNFYIPRFGSPAIDAISSCITSAINGLSLATDQRGQPRPRFTGNNCDIGAIEHEGYRPPPPTSNDGGSGGGGSDGEDDASRADQASPVSTCLTLDGIAAYNISESTQCQRLNAMQIANPNIKEGDFVDAVDVWSWVLPNTQICFEAAGGSFTFIDTAAMPRTAHEPEAYSKDGMTCAKVDGPGILVLLPGDRPGDRPAPAAADAATKTAKAAPAVPAAQSLSNCMVRTQFNLNFRAAPDGEIVGEVPHNSTLTALERTAGWFKVDYHGERGWISAEYVDKKGTCG